MSDSGNINSNMHLCSYITEQEIFKLKNEFNTLIMKLFNAHNIEEETSINNEIRNQTEFLSSLLAIKRNELNKNIHMNNLQMIDLQQMMQQQMMQLRMKLQQKIQAQQEELSNSLNKNKINESTVIFRASWPDGEVVAPIYIKFKPDDKVSKIIEEYRRQSGDNDLSKKFIFNAKNLQPYLTADETGLLDNANIFVVSTKYKKEGCAII